MAYEVFTGGKVQVALDKSRSKVFKINNGSGFWNQVSRKTAEAAMDYVFKKGFEVGFMEDHKIN